MSGGRLRSSIRVKVVVATVVTLAVVCGAVGAFLRAASERNLRVVTGDALRRASHAFAVLQRADVEKLDTTLAALASNPALAEAFASRDRARLLGVAAPIFARLKAEHDVTHWYFHDPSRVCFLRVHEPSKFGEVVDRVTLAQAAATGRRGAGTELGQTAIALRVVEPYVVGGRRVGYLELGEEIDHFLARMKAQTGDDYALVADKSRLDRALYASVRWGRESGWDDMPDRVIVERTVARVPVHGVGALAALPADGVLLGEVEQGGRIFARGAVPVADAAGQPFGAIVVLHDVTALRVGMLRTRLMVTVAIAAAAALLVAAILLIMQRLVFARLARMIATMEDLSARLAGGDHAIVPPPPGPPDEIGRFEDFFGRFLTVIGGLLEELTHRRTG